MSDGLHVCKKCGHEMSRHAKGNGGYRYTCGCEEWAKMLGVLAHATKKENRRRRRRDKHRGGR